MPDAAPAPSPSRSQGVPPSCTPAGGRAGQSPRASSKEAGEPLRAARDDRARAFLEQSPLWNALVLNRAAMNGAKGRQPVDQVPRESLPTRYIPLEVAAVHLFMSESGVRMLLRRLGLPWVRLPVHSTAYLPDQERPPRRFITPDVLAECSRERLRYAKVFRRLENRRVSDTVVYDDRGGVPWRRARRPDPDHHDEDDA